MHACRSSECYDVITYKVEPYKCSWCDRVFVSPYGEETVSMQNRNILENYYTRRTGVIGGEYHINAR